MTVSSENLRGQSFIDDFHGQSSQITKKFNQKMYIV